jgi:DNA processing protein
MNNTFDIRSLDGNFPMPLSQCYPPVKMLFGIGSLSCVERLAQHPGLAIVGSRQASPQGLLDARWFAREASLAGLTVISGLAQGIDGAAHQGALEGSASTVAVLAHGRDHLYPAVHRGLAQEILAGEGALLTEYPDGTPALPGYFPSRNRIIAALARAVLVIEAAPQSGSLITARHALDLGVDVFVLPGSIHLPQSVGSNQLIRQGAQLVQSPQQLLEDLGVVSLKAEAPLLGGQRRSASKASDALKSLGQPSITDQVLAEAPALFADPRADKVLGHLTFQPADLGALEKACQMARGDLYAGLLILEFNRQAARLSDGRWLRVDVKM